MTTVELLLLCNTVLLTLIWWNTLSDSAKEESAEITGRLVFAFVVPAFLFAIVVLVDLLLLGGVIFD